ncbi:class I lanthipeptide [Flavobacterium sp. CAU 1735]|uniref:class I lanthipeptide n=1 Tax=Flavobacterium sp. CAU 1735 TaxID=3140361 RepID=UPI003260D161
MKTTNTNKLAFTKNALVELNETQMNTVNGGGASILTSFYPLTTVTVPIIVKTIVAAN